MSQGNINPYRSVLRFLAALFILFTLYGCARHVVHQRDETSRDFTYISFSQETSPYVHKGQVGGEHSTFVKVLGFAGDRFTVKMQQQGDAGFTVYGEGVLINRDKSIFNISVDAADTLFTVEVSALNYGDYTLTITPK